ncbi:hypothetical protein [Nocardioides marmotae]|uniref:hypothetical protein n=1 Tax=Nocardioides marmotae TaxID=2663857 RepID=UPI0012B50AB9|nr:hypothetical protein [Nocardioides marmotae]MBC9735353.1 hypothetical protein [Nocardioides marmotae]MTB86453.1 hypothetical protein [Nocardioides marmotae]
MAEDKQPAADLFDRWLTHREQGGGARTPQPAAAREEVRPEASSPEPPAEPAAAATPTDDAGSEDPLFDDSFVPSASEPAAPPLFEATAPDQLQLDFEPVIIPSARKRNEKSARLTRRRPRRPEAPPADPSEPAQVEAAGLAEQARREAEARLAAQVEAARAAEEARQAEQRAEADRLAAEAARRAEEERVAAEAARAAEQERIAEQARREAEARLAAQVEAARAAEEARQAEQRAEADRLAAEAARRAEQDRLAAEAARAAEQERIAEQARREAAARLATQAEAARAAEEERLAAQAAAARAVPTDAPRAMAVAPPAPPATPTTEAEPAQPVDTAPTASTNHVFKPRTGPRRAVGILLLVALVATAGAAYLASEDPTTFTLGLAGTLGALTLVLWAVRAGSAVTRMSVTAGQLEVLRGGGRFVFDLRSRYTPIEVVGEPGSRGWKVLFVRRSMAPFVIDSSMVDPEEFMQVLRQHRPERVDQH